MRVSFIAAIAEKVAICPVEMSTSEGYRFDILQIFLSQSSERSTLTIVSNILRRQGVINDVMCSKPGFRTCAFHYCCARDVVSTYVTLCPVADCKIRSLNTSSFGSGMREREEKALSRHEAVCNGMPFCSF